jgi:hypothetical protein
VNSEKKKLARNLPETVELSKGIFEEAVYKGSTYLL